MLNNLLIQRGFRRTLPQPRTRCGRAFPADRGFANRLTLFLGIGLSSLLWPGISLGQGADRTPLNLVRLEISPAELPTPALKYKLTRSFEETVDGDAAPIYYRAFLRLGLLGYSREDWANLARWNAITPENIPADLLAGQLKQAKDVFREADLASRQSDCHWPLERQTLDPAAFADAQLPELELARRLAILIALRSRLAIFDGRIDDCLDGLKTGFELATDVGQGQTLIHAIVGNSIAMQMYQVVLQLVGQPNAPNMYWAVTQLPEPFIPLRPAIETEMHSLFGALPLLANPESAVHTPAEWRALTIQTLSHARTLQGKDVFNESRAEQDVPARLEMSPEEEFERLVPLARERLIASGWSAPKVEQMSDGQAVAVEMSRSTKVLRDEFFKAAFLPYRKAWGEYQRFSEAFPFKDSDAQTVDSAELVPLGRKLIPSIPQVQLQLIASGRLRASIQLVEALRLHLATDGLLPSGPVEIRNIPLPVDPWTEQPIPFLIDNGRATFGLPAPAGASREGNEINFDISIRR